MIWLLAAAALVGLVQSVVWIGRPSAPAGRRVLGVFAAALCLIVFAIALAAIRVPALGW